MNGGTLGGQDVNFNETKNVFEVSVERYKIFVQHEIELDAALDLIDLKDQEIESLNIIISEKSAIISAKQIIQESLEKEKSSFEIQSKIFGSLSVTLGLVVLIETFFLILN